jgi:hypothetical protein
MGHDMEIVEYDFKDAEFRRVIRKSSASKLIFYHQLIWAELTRRLKITHNGSTKEKMEL